MKPPQSPDDEAGILAPADLLAAARRRLPPEVPVVGLPAGLVAGAVAPTGCFPPPQEARAAAAESRAHVRGVARDLLSGLDEVGDHPVPPQGTWAGCDDVGGTVLYQVLDRLEPAAGRPGPLVEAVRTRLRAAGLRLRVVGAASDDRVTLLGAVDGVEVQVTGYASRAEVLLDLTGPCLDFGDVDRDLLSELAEDLDLAEPARPAEAAGPADGRVACALCGATSPTLPLGWSTGRERGRPVVHCERCSRENVRAMESKLDPQWW